MKLFLQFTFSVLFSFYVIQVLDGLVVYNDMHSPVRKDTIDFFGWFFISLMAFAYGWLGWQLGNFFAFLRSI